MTTIKSITLPVLLAAMILTCGCYLHITSPLDIDVDNTSLGSKTGKASFQSVLWMVAWGDAGSAAAAKNGDISIINHMDRERFTFLWGAYYKETTIVYGD